jgi:hypothetical protein
MKRVFTANIASGDQEIVLSLLETAEIPCLVRNANLSMALSELTPMESAPEIWILQDEDLPRAREIIAAWRTTEIEDPGPWTCGCGEAIEGQFTSCWNCGKERQTNA